MIDNLFHTLVRGFISGLAGLSILTTATCPFPVQAHTGISGQIDDVTARIRDEPEVPGLYLRRGALHRINGHWSEAMADFHQARQLDPDNVAADLGMGRTRLDQGLYEDAIEHLNRALARQAGNVRGLVTRARAFRLIGEPLAAAADYKHAITAFKEPDKPLPEYYLGCARALESAGATHIPAAVQALDDGIGRLGHIRALEDYAIELERKRKNYNAALLRLDRIIDRSVRKEALLTKRGEILMEADQPAVAEADFAAAREAIDALPAQRRNTRTMKQLRKDIDSRMHSLKHDGGRE
jgi:tetratricopeptide (TPR) repeat protein